MSNLLEEYKQEIKLNKEELEQVKNKLYAVRDSTHKEAKSSSCDLIYDNAVLIKTCEVVGGIVLDNLKTINVQGQTIDHKDNEIKELNKLLNEEDMEKVKFITKPLIIKEAPKSIYQEEFRKLFIKAINKDKEINKKLGYN